jgi:probable F420-dependent oxidoreductase
MASMKFGVALGRLNPAFFVPVVDEAERLGYESVWLPEHLVFPIEMGGSPFPEQDHPPVPPSTPVFDAFAYLSFLAGRTEHVKLATHVYLLGLRHPFISARAIATLDIVSGGRAIVGIGAGWLSSEWDAIGLDFASRGRRVDEALEVCRRLWTDEVIEQHGEFFDFGPVMFEPKPVQKPHPPVIVGGESPPALRRAARAGDGWVGLDHTLDTIDEPLAKLRKLREEAGRADEPFEITVGGPVHSEDDISRWEEAGVDRLICSPWRRSPEAVDGLRAFSELAEAHLHRS